jgi:hypothetical protein
MFALADHCRDIGAPDVEGEVQKAPGILRRNPVTAEPDECLLWVERPDAVGSVPRQDTVGKSVSVVWSQSPEGRKVVREFDLLVLGQFRQLRLTEDIAKNLGIQTLENGANRTEGRGILKPAPKLD